MYKRSVAQEPKSPYQAPPSSAIASELVKAKFHQSSISNLNKKGKRQVVLGEVYAKTFFFLPFFRFIGEKKRSWFQLKSLTFLEEPGRNLPL